MNWPRVNRQTPCPICKHPDWCCFTPDLASVRCMRVESPVPTDGGGWMHHVTDTPRVTLHLDPLPPPQIDAARLMSCWAGETTQEDICGLAKSLGVSMASLTALGAAWAHQHAAWAFPMRDGQGGICGIRLRNNKGEKWAVKGSRQGLFVPSAARQDVVLICEGPTDTAAAITLGFFAIGRPSCLGCETQLHATLIRLKVRRVVIVADNDAPGLRGAAKLAESISMPHIVLCPPCKDIRQYVARGGRRGLIDSSIQQKLWRKNNGR